jgi:hypothetical protein
MPKTINVAELHNELTNVAEKLLRLYKLNEDLIGDPHYYTNDAEHNTQVLEIVSFLQTVEREAYKLTLSMNEIKAEGYLTKATNGRYQLDDYELTSGMSVEVLEDLDWDEKQVWHKTSIEHNGEDYYAVALGRNESLEGEWAYMRGVHQ